MRGGGEGLVHETGREQRERDKKGGDRDQGASQGEEVIPVLLYVCIHTHMHTL